MRVDKIQDAGVSCTGVCNLKFNNAKNLISIPFTSRVNAVKAGRWFLFNDRKPVTVIRLQERYTYREFCRFLQ